MNYYSFLMARHSVVTDSSEGTVPVEKCRAECGSSNCSVHGPMVKSGLSRVDSVAKNGITAEEDAAYIDAVEHGDKETASRMVRDAAGRAMPNTKVVDNDGLPKVMYHGSESDSVKSFNGGAYGGTYLTTIKSDAEERVSFYENGKVYQLFVNIEKPIVTNNWESSGFEEVPELCDYTDLRAKPIVDNGYDGAIVNFVSGHKDVFVVNPSQIKSSDPLTYDDAGDVIPLSKRFDFTNPDIRY